MLHARFKDHRISISVGENFQRLHGSHLGNVNWTILNKLSFLLPKQTPHNI